MCIVQLPFMAESVALLFTQHVILYICHGCTPGIRWTFDLVSLILTLSATFYIFYQDSLIHYTYCIHILFCCIFYFSTASIKQADHHQCQGFWRGLCNCKWLKKAIIKAKSRKLTLNALCFLLCRLWLSIMQHQKRGVAPARTLSLIWLLKGMIKVRFCQHFVSFRGKHDHECDIFQM